MKKFTLTNRFSLITSIIKSIDGAKKKIVKKTIHWPSNRYLTLFPCPNDLIAMVTCELKCKGKKF